MTAAFTADKVSDQKRVARAEHYLMARNLLRVRDRKHHAKWNVLILPGQAPEGEIRCIRELMPRAHIVAVDRDPIAYKVSLYAGVDSAVCTDLATDEARLLAFEGHFDVVALDTCGPASDDLELLWKVCRPSAHWPGILRGGGVGIVTFSYGRDVVEYAIDFAKRASGSRSRSPYPPRSQEQYEKLRVAGLGEAMIGRILMIGGTRLLRSVILYRGNEMPMCSLLYCITGSSAQQRPVEVITLGAGDYEICVAHPDPTTMYDTPRERIEALRRSHAAIKASYTRKLVSKTPQEAGHAT